MPDLGSGSEFECLARTANDPRPILPRQIAVPHRHHAPDGLAQGKRHQQIALPIPRQHRRPTTPRDLRQRRMLRLWTAVPERAHSDPVAVPFFQGVFGLNDKQVDSQSTEEQRLNMPPISIDRHREIVEDFASRIREKKSPGPKPATTVINFRNDKRDNVERPVELVPIELLRYRKENGRIASDVANYQKSNGPLKDDDDRHQEILRRFLEEKDPERTDILMKSIAHTGQNEAAIITCDGFLINGNRRKMAFEELRKREPGREDYRYMKVVILPGPGDPGGAPTLLDIERLENRYQLQSEGKSEYYGFDRALSIKNKIEVGFSLEEQLRDDPHYARATDKEIAQAVKTMEVDYLLPLECVDRYLALFAREGLYKEVSSGRGDREGRWQAFLDYSNTQQRYFQSPKWRLEKGVEEEDIGGFEDAAFKIIKLRHLKGLPKLHVVMRQLPKLCAYKESRKEILKISDDVEAVLPARESRDCDGDLAKLDEKWAERSQQNVIHRLKRALDLQENNQDKETPLALLEAAYRKLVHENMSVDSIGVADFDRARKLTGDIQKRANEIEREIYQCKKDHEALARKK